ncbi:hypothetical protein [Sphingobacterium faecium]|uniref:hypothetical protein n=1 Tax=Sphingobacterium faecium TaxID=34087 RepID=UPI0024688643|nr:hypothetical protein [Sphingobacterium faecium]MDH5826238.1 hypothetical protein [Sphingobacterium faecium]
MISAATLNLEGALIQLAFFLFLGAGILYTLIIWVYHLINKIEKNGSYYVRSFFVSGFFVLLLAVFIFCIALQII